MLVTGEKILELIPQKPPMVMVDKLFECTGDSGTTGFTIPPDNILVKDGRFTEPGLVENIAQSCALMTGWLGRSEIQGEQKSKMGVIGGIKDLRIYFLPEAGTEIITEIQVVHRIGNATIVNGKVRAGERISVECELKIFSFNEENRS